MRIDCIKLCFSLALVISLENSYSLGFSGRILLIQGKNNKSLFNT